MGRVEGVHRKQREDDRGQPPWAEPSDERQVRRSSRKPKQAIATGTMWITVSASTANTTPPLGVLEGRYQHRRPDDEPHEEREHLAGDVRERDRWFEVGGSASRRRPCPATKAATNPFAPTWTVPA